MGLTAVVSPSGSSGGALSLLSALGVGAGSVFVIAILVYLLAYLNVIEASERNRQRLRWLLVSVSIPLVFAFAGVVLFESLDTLGYL